jgi:hypothetical protein
MMKIFFVLLMAFSCSAWAEWKFIERGTSSKDAFFIDPLTIKKEGNKRKVWELSNLFQMGKNGEMSTRSRTEYDCKEKQYRFIQISYFPGEFATGLTLLIDNFQINGPGGEWREIAPGTVDEALFKFVCTN